MTRPLYVGPEVGHHVFQLQDAGGHGASRLGQERVLGRGRCQIFLKDDQPLHHGIPLVVQGLQALVDDLVERLGVAEPGALALQLGVLVGRYPGGPDFPLLELQKGPLLVLTVPSGLEGFEPVDERGHFPVTLPNPSAQRGQAGVPVQEPQVPVGLQQSLVGVLAGNAGQVLRDVRQGLDGGQSPVDVDAVAVFAGDDPPDEQTFGRVVAATVHAFGRGPVRVDVELGLQLRGCRAGPDEPGRDPSPEKQVDRIDDDGFARPGLTAENGQPVGEIDPQIVDDREIFDGQLAQHLYLG